MVNNNILYWQLLKINAGIVIILFGLFKAFGTLPISDYHKACVSKKSCPFVCNYTKNI